MAYARDPAPGRLRFSPLSQLNRCVKPGEALLRALGGHGKDLPERRTPVTTLRAGSKGNPTEYATHGGFEIQSQSFISLLRARNGKQSHSVEVFPYKIVRVPQSPVCSVRPHGGGGPDVLHKQRSSMTGPNVSGQRRAYFAVLAGWRPLDVRKTSKRSDDFDARP